MNKLLKDYFPKDILSNIFLLDSTYKELYNIVIESFTKYQCWQLDINLTPVVMDQSMKQFRYVSKIMQGY